MPLKNRHETSVANIQYRDKRPDTKKILFISCEGPVTEELYFKILSENIFDRIKTKIRPVSAREDFNSIKPELRTKEDRDEQNKSTPRQVMERLDKFLEKYNNLYMPEQNTEDEYWIIIDVDDHTNEYHIDEWNNVLNECDEKKYQYAVSNPFFEFWLFLHHLDVCDEAHKYAVTCEHMYEKTTYYVKQIKSAGAKMTGKGSKRPYVDDYNIEKVNKAIQQAEKLHTNRQEKWPSSLGTTVYLLVKKMTDMLNGD